MSPRVLILGGAALAALAPLTGCETPPPAGPFPAQPEYIETGNYPAVAVEPALQPFLVVDYGAVVVNEPTQNAPLTVQVPVRSTAYEQFVTQYRFFWSDEQGVATGETAWRLLPMEPGMLRTIQGVANDGESTRWRLEIRSAR